MAIEFKPCMMAFGKPILAIPLCVAAATGAVAGGAHLISATTLGTVVNTTAFTTADILGKLVGPLLMSVGVIMAFTAGPVAKKIKESLPHSEENEKKIHDNAKITVVASATAVAVSIGFTIVGNIEPIAVDVVQNLNIAAGVFGAIALVMMILDAYANRSAPEQTV